MATTGQAIVDRAWYILQDKGSTPGVRWTSAEQLLWVNEFQREVVTWVPSAYVKQYIATAEASKTRQTFSGLSIADGVQVIDVPRNFAADGTTPGRAITIINRKELDDIDPNWHAVTSTAAQHYMVDSRDPKAFYLYPAITGGGKVEVICNAVPANLAALSDSLVLDDIYANAGVNYVLFRDYSKNSVFSKSPEQAAAYYRLFLQSLGVKDAKRPMQAPSRASEQPIVGGVSK